MFTPTSALDLENSIGFTKHYGFSPSIKLCTKSQNQSQTILMISSIDHRHILKTISSDFLKEKKSFNFIFLNDTPASFLRNLILHYILTEETLTFREKIETYLDLYWNTFVTAKSINICQKIADKIDAQLAQRKLSNFNLKYFKYKDFDDVLEQLTLWRKAMSSNFLKIDSCFSKYFLNRQMAHFKERWEVRKNMIDGDFIWGIKDNKIEIQKTDKKSDKVITNFPTQPCINFGEYHAFRENGIAFTIHDSIENHKFFNVTMLNYQSGKSKKDKSSCEVLGFWGDISIGPFSTFGIYLDSVIDYDEFYDTRNFELYRKSSEIAFKNVSNLVEGFIKNTEQNLINFEITPIFKDVKKNVNKLNFEKYLIDCYYVALSSYCDLNEETMDYFKSLQNLEEKNNIRFIFETPKFYNILDLKKRSQMKQALIEKLEKGFGMQIVEDKDHHIYCTLKTD